MAFHTSFKYCCESWQGAAILTLFCFIYNIRFETKFSLIYKAHVFFLNEICNRMNIIYHPQTFLWSPHDLIRLTNPANRGPDIWYTFSVTSVQQHLTPMCQKKSTSGFNLMSRHHIDHVQFLYIFEWLHFPLTAPCTHP